MPPKILVVDDEEHIRKLYGEELQEAGYAVIAAENGYKLMELLEREAPDLVILDIKMVDYNGLDLLQDIRGVFFDLPVILCTAYDTFKDDFRAIAADHYVSKSFDLTELKKKIAISLETRVPGIESPNPRGRVLEFIGSRIKDIIIKCKKDEILSVDNSSYKRLLTELDMLSCFRFVSKEDVDSAFLDACYEYRSDILKLNNSIREYIFKHGYEGIEKAFHVMYEEASPLKFLSSREFIPEADRIIKAIDGEFDELGQQLEQLCKSIKHKEYSGLDLAKLKHALAVSTTKEVEYSSVVDIISADIRHDFKNRLSKMLFYLESIRKEISSNPLEGVVSLIRSVQEGEGNRPCFASEQSQSCKESHCSWWRDCTRFFPDSPIGGGIKKLLNVHSDLSSISDRMHDISTFMHSPTFKDISIKTFLDNVVSSFRLIDPVDVGIELTFDQDCTINTDPNMLSVALRQLIQNSIDAYVSTARSGIIKVDAVLFTLNKSIDITISDNGPGMARDRLALMFGEENLYAKKDHLGIGLRLARLAASEIGGSIRMESELGVGTKTTVTIPA